MICEAPTPETVKALPMIERPVPVRSEIVSAPMVSEPWTERVLPLAKVKVSAAPTAAKVVSASRFKESESSEKLRVSASTSEAVMEVPKVVVKAFPDTVNPVPVRSEIVSEPTINDP